MNRRTVAAAICLAALAFLALAQASASPPTGSITFVVGGLKSDDGAVLVSLFDNGKHFPKQSSKAVGKGRSIIQGGIATVTFSDLPAGTYAAALLHDENNNREMDYNLLGIPSEGYGFSNNAKASFGPPSFRHAAMRLDREHLRTTIKIIYL